MCQLLKNEEVRKVLSKEISLHPLLQETYNSAFYHLDNIKDDYTFGKELGKGGYGSVFLCQNKLTKVVRAIKVVEKDSVESEDMFRNEFKILMELDHPNIIKLYEIYETDHFIYLVQE